MSNKDLIYDLVESHFSLSKESLEVFKDKLYNPTYDDFYKQFGLDENHRKYWKLDDATREKIDKGWKYFKEYYPNFCEFYKVSYKDFKDNRITDERKNKVKLIKALTNFYKDNEEYTNSRISQTAGRREEIIKYLSENSFAKINIFSNNFGISRYAQKQGCYEETPIEGTFYPKFTFIEEKFTEELYAGFINDNIKVELEKIGRVKLSNNEISLVLSLNFEDWLFCSTGESWTSCLNLDSDHMFWSGLPGLITDPNRAMLYITDGEKKRPMESIDIESLSNLSVDRLISRSWVFVGEGDDLIVSKSYPGRMLDMKALKEIIGYEKIFESMDVEEEGMECKKPFRLLYHTNGNSLSIYFDELDLVIDEDGVGEEKLFKFRFSEESGTRLYSISNGFILKGFDVVSSDEGTLFEMIERGGCVRDGLFDIRVVKCHGCGKMLEVYYDFYFEKEGRTYCQRCYMKDRGF